MCRMGRVALSSRQTGRWAGRRYSRALDRYGRPELRAVVRLPVAPCGCVFPPCCPMHHTIFDTPVVNTLLRAVSCAILRLAGWKVEGALPAHAAKSVLIAAPHTSNWDLPYTLMLAFSLRLRVRWIGKQSLFRAPFGGVMRWLGGIPVNRAQSGNLVASSAQAMRDVDGPMQLIVPPEGTRGKTRHWKTGFYYIAQQAGVPIVLAFVDYGRKVGGLGPVFQPTGNIDTDMARIKAFYAPIQGKNPTQFDPEAPG